jgi:predicted metalloendopeptidase
VLDRLYLKFAIFPPDILNKLDESTKPCDDFYQYSCGGFLKKTRLPDNKLYMDSSTVTTDYVQYSLRDLLQNERLMSNYSEVIQPIAGH